MGFQSMNKKGFSFKAGMFAIVAVSLMVIAFATIISESSDVYGTDVESELSAFNKLNEISAFSEGYEESLTPDDQEPGEDPEASTFRGVYGILTGVFNVFDVVAGEGGMISSLTTQFGLDDDFRKGIVTLIFIAIAFSLVAVIFRLARGSA